MNVIMSDISDKLNQNGYFKLPQSDKYDYIFTKDSFIYCFEVNNYRIKLSIYDKVCGMLISSSIDIIDNSIVDLLLKNTLIDFDKLNEIRLIALYNNLTVRTNAKLRVEFNKYFFEVYCYYYYCIEQDSHEVGDDEYQDTTSVTQNWNYFVVFLGNRISDKYVSNLLPLNINSSDFSYGWGRSGPIKVEKVTFDEKATFEFIENYDFKKHWEYRNIYP